MSDWKIRRRTRLKSKQNRALMDDLQGLFGDVGLWDPGAAVEEADVQDLHIVLVNNTVLGIRDDTGPFLTVRGLLSFRPPTRFVTVDMGAVKFVHNGADVMAPGIVDADEALEVGDWCWIRDEKNHQPLGIGKCLVTGAVMKAGTKGKAVKSVHHIGDKLWELDA